MNQPTKEFLSIATPYVLMMFIDMVWLELSLTQYLAVTAVIFLCDVMSHARGYSAGIRWAITQIEEMYGESKR